ncbi:MAG: DNA repair protein RecO [Synergistaceae bacterium]|jgi:DNA repair protein RecO (recombination protein O)|nr:DNA repair protein RecO [Synergistaceae bacterium]
MAETGRGLGRQGFETASGVVLHRRVVREGDLLLTLFLRGLGKIRVSAGGAASGKVRFGGGTEPLVWGSFGLYRDRIGNFRLKNADVADDLLKLRGRAESLFAGVRWAKLLLARLPEEEGADDLLTALYWDMKLLEGREFPVQVVNFHFLWRWLKLWGLAPDLTLCVRCGKKLEAAFWTEDGLRCEDCSPQKGGWALSPGETAGLRVIAGMKASAVVAARETRPDLPEPDLFPKRLFDDAARRLEGLLEEI